MNATGVLVIDECGGPCTFYDVCGFYYCYLITVACGGICLARRDFSGVSPCSFNAIDFFRNCSKVCLAVWLTDFRVGCCTHRYLETGYPTSSVHVCVHGCSFVPKLTKRHTIALSSFQDSWYLLWLW